MDRKMGTLAVLALASLAVMAGALLFAFGREPAFVPPPFDPQAQAGVPREPGEDWSRICLEGLDFSAHVRGKVGVGENRALVWFTNDEGNRVWLKLRLLDGEGQLLGETGLLRPGEYVQWMELKGTVEAGTEVVLKIMAYQPETYTSAGALSLRTQTVALP